MHMRLVPTFEPRHEISNNVVCATSKGSDQPAHTQSFGVSKLKRGCTDSSESTLVNMPHCWKSHAAAHFISRLYSDYYHEYGRLRNTLEPGPKHFHEVVVTGLHLYEECLQTRTLRSCVYDERIYDVVKVGTCSISILCSILVRCHHIFFF